MFWECLDNMENIRWRPVDRKWRGKLRKPWLDDVEDDVKVLGGEKLTKGENEMERVKAVPKE